MNSVQLRISTLAVGTLFGVLATFRVHADSDEAWLQRARLPNGVQPLLAIVIDTSAATGEMITVAEAYDPARNYGAGLAAACDASRVFWRRGVGPVPDCRQQVGVELSPARVTEGLQCEAARGPLEIQGYFIASRAAQWRADGNYWSEPKAGSADAIECRADRGRHGAAPGTWHASDGPDGPWNGSTAVEIAWDDSPFANAYAFYSGNYLNYLETTQVPVERPIRDVMLQTLAATLAATADLEVAIVRIDNDGPEGGYVARAPVASALAASEFQALAGELPAGSAPLAETMAEAAAWLSGAPIRFGSDSRADATARDAATSSYKSPFGHACRPVSLAVVTAGQSSDDDLAASAAGALPRFEELTGGCGSGCLAALQHWIQTADLSEALPGTQNAAVEWMAPPVFAEALPATVDPIADPQSYLNLVVRAFQHDAAVPAAPQLSAAAMTLLSDAIAQAGHLLWSDRTRGS